MRKKRNPAAMKIASDIIAAYKSESVAEMHEAIKDVFGPMFEAILNSELENYLGYESNSKVQVRHFRHHRRYLRLQTQRGANFQNY